MASFITREGSVGEFKFNGVQVVNGRAVIGNFEDKFIRLYWKNGYVDAPENWKELIISEIEDDKFSDGAEDMELVLE